MKRVGVREFRDHATQYLASGEVLAVERHGRAIGFYIPVSPAPEEERQRAVTQLGIAVERLLAESGLSEDELAAVLDRAQPAPAEPALPGAHAPGH